MNDRLTIGVLAPIYGGFFFTSILLGLHKVIAENNGQLVAIQTQASNYAGAWRKDFQYPIAYSHIDGWAVIIGAVDPLFLDSLISTGRPVVSICRPVNGCYNVMPDNRRGMAKAVRHLIEHGHKNIAFVGYLENNDMKERYEGYKETLAEFGLEFDPQLTFNAPDTLVEGGNAAGIKMLRARAKFTAATICTDLNALGVMEIFKSAGLHLPEDLALTSFDGIPEAEFYDPPLTTIKQSFIDIGTVAGQTLISHLKKRVNKTINENIFVDNELIIRSSCGCPPQKPANQAPLTADNPKNYFEKNLISSLLDQVNLSTNLTHTGYLELNLFNTFKIIQNQLISLPSADKTLADKTLDWMQFTSISAACIGQWVEPGNPESPLRITQTYSRNNLTLETSKPVRLQDFPPLELTENMSSKNYLAILPLETPTTEWGFLAMIVPMDAPLENSLNLIWEWAQLLTIFLEWQHTMEKLNTTSDDNVKLKARIYQLEDQNSTTERQNNLLKKNLEKLAHEANNELDNLITTAGAFKEPQAKTLENIPILTNGFAQVIKKGNSLTRILHAIEELAKM